MYRYFLKRVIDFLVALFLLIILFPFILLIFLWLFLVTKDSPFFFQIRPGKNGKLFRLMKFKTMNDRKDEAGNLLPDKDRFTGIGLILRKTSLDEIPQLINVLKGEMSLVGPRPLLVDYLPLYNTVQARRHEVLPGITGWAQVNGRNTIGWNEKFTYDVWYVDHLSFITDLKIIWLTLAKVIRREGINSNTEITMERFMGN